MSGDDDRASAIYGLALLLIIIISLFGVRACHEKGKVECRARGGKVVEIHGAFFKWACVEK